MKRPHADNEENYDMEQEKSSSVTNAFKTAREQLVMYETFFICKICREPVGRFLPNLPGYIIWTG